MRSSISYKFDYYYYLRIQAWCVKNVPFWQRLRAQWCPIQQSCLLMVFQFKFRGTDHLGVGKWTYACRRLQAPLLPPENIRCGFISFCSDFEFERAANVPEARSHVRKILGIGESVENFLRNGGGLMEANSHTSSLNGYSLATWKNTPHSMTLFPYATASL